MSDEPSDTAITVLPTTGAAVVGPFRHEAMACVWEAFIAGQEARYARQAAQAAFAEVDRLDQELSRFIPHSDIARINALAPGQSVRIGIDALECLELAATIHGETLGAFDVTVGALLKRGGAGQAASPAVGLHLLEIQRAIHSVTVHAAGLIVDLGGIGKGYALDRAVAVFREWGIGAALIHSGQSTVYALGGPPGQPGWTVSLRNPADHSTSLGQLCLRDNALSGSGMQLHGPHIIDPRTGGPAAGALAAWALAPTAAVADALSTAFMVLTPAEVEDYCRRHPDVSALLSVGTAEGHRLLRHGGGSEAVAGTTR